MGVHISKVRSLMLDVLDPHLLKFLKSVGNARANQKIWEQTLWDEHGDYESVRLRTVFST